MQYFFSVRVLLTLLNTRAISWLIVKGSLGNDDGDVNENGEKSNWFSLAKQQLYTCIMLFCTFLSIFAVTARLRRKNA